MERNPLLQWPAIVIAMLSLSIGWGIRGDYGHEFGAMMPGMLCAVAVCLMSGRADWRQRVLFFALFGAIGWGFGGSIAYMPTMSYTHSGHWPTQAYGWLTVFVVGFLWAGMGGAGTAYAAVETRERLTAVFRPLCWVLAAWTVQYFFEDRIVSWYLGASGDRDFRQKSPFYWLDSQWMEANWAFLGLCLFELWDRRFKQIQWLAVLGAAGAALGWLVQWVLGATGLLAPLLGWLVRYQWDPTAVNPATGHPFELHNMVTNWPQLFFDLSNHLGWILGLLLGLTVFFVRFGRWRAGSSLLMHITVGSFVVFLVGPVLLSPLFMRVGGFRMTPPRGDSWANIIGCFAGMLLYMFRNSLKPVGYTAIVSGVLGGLGFLAAQFTKILCGIPGNPVLSSDPAWLGRWQHWRSANWHNIVVEQGVGLLYGLAIVVSMGLLANRFRPLPAEPRVRKWTESFSVFFILIVLLYVNLVKNVPDWTQVYGAHSAVPAVMRAPLIPQIVMSALGWFNLTFLLMGACLAAILWAHSRRPLAMVPASWVGRAQIFYLIFLWAILIGNWEKALPGFHEQRLATEWLMMVNGLIVTFLVLYFGRDEAVAPKPALSDFVPVVRRVVAMGVAGILLAMFGFTFIQHLVYGDRFDNMGGRNLRFGPEADWRIRPILKDKAHR